MTKLIMGQPKKIKTDKDRVHAVIASLTESHLDTIGGYPYAGLWVGDTFVYATLEDNETDIHSITKKQMIAWCKRAEKFQAKHKDGYDFYDCLMETE